MAGKVEERRAALRDRLVEAAETRIARDGVAALRARDLAKDAGCAVGAIYNAFADMDAIVMAVNGRTFKRLGTQVKAAVAQKQSPTDQLIAMSGAYLEFAAQNSRLWRALFDIELPEDSDVPEWYRAALAQLFSHIDAPVAQIFPDQSAAERQLTVRALFSSIHGIVLLGLENRISGVPRDHIKQMISLLLTQMTVRNS